MIGHARPPATPEPSFAGDSDGFEAFAPATSDASRDVDSDASRDVDSDASRDVDSDASRGAHGDGSLRRCAWCERPFVPSRRDAEFHEQKCRQAAYRFRRRRATEERAARALRVAYADPPYPGRAYLYKDQPSYAGEVDHRALLSSMEAFDGWALSTSESALGLVLPLCPRGVRVCSWVKAATPIDSRGRGPQGRWEPLIVKPARLLGPVPTFLIARPARGGDSDLIGRKPLAFVAWCFDLLGLLPRDDFTDLFPGSGVFGRAFREMRRRSSGDASPMEERLTSSPSGEAWR